MYLTKNFFSKIGVNIRKLIKRFPITLLAIILTTLIYTFLVDTSFLGRTIIYEITEFGGLFAIGTFCIEICTNSKIKKFLYSGVIGIISFILVGIYNYTPIEINTNIIVLKEIIVRVIICYVISLLALSIYKLVKQSEENFESFLTHIFSNLFVTGIIYAVLAIGFLLISVIFVFLILNGSSASIIFKIQVLLFGLYYIPSLIYSFTNINGKDITKFIKNLVIYVLLPLVSIAIAIIYMYIVKIIIEGNMPENFIYRIISSIFVVAAPVWIMSSYFCKESKFANILSNALPYLFIPLILLEAYSMYLRIADYGITPLRYLSILFAVFQLILIILCVYKNKKYLNHIFIYAIAFILIATISPVNMQLISNLSQKSIIEKYVKNEDELNSLDIETKIRVIEAYNYLKDVAEADKYIPEFMKNIEDTDNNFSNIQEEMNTNRIIMWNNEKNSIDISGFTKLIPYSISEKFGSGNNSNVNEIIMQYIQNVLEQEEGNEIKFINNNNFIIINENEKIAITNFYLMYDSEHEEANFISIQGYLLSK